MINPSGSHLTHHTTAERFASLPGRLMATTSAMVITIALFLLPATDAAAAPTLSVVYQDSWTLSQSGWAEESSTGNFGGCFIETCAPDLTLPQFNPALGTLESVQFSGTISLSGAVQTGCSGYFFFFCNSTATLSLEGAINLNDVTTSSGQRINNFGPNLSLDISRSVTCNPVPFTSCTSGYAYSSFGSIIGGGRTFSGTSSVAPFIGTGQIQFPFSPSLDSYNWMLTQSDAPDSASQFLTSGKAEVVDTVVCLLVEDPVGCALELAATEFLKAENGGQLPATGCCYGLGAVDMGRDVVIVYTYEPASVSAPEPSTLALLSVAVIPLAIACTRRRGRTTTNAASALPTRPS